MKKKIKATLSARPGFLIIAGKFNEFIALKLLKACIDEFGRHGVNASQVRVVWVPGAFEMPLAALKLGREKNVKAVICLGAVIRGETFHYELVAREAARGIMDVSLALAKPVIFEVLAADTVALCEARARDGDRDNKGAAAARAAIEMARMPG